MSYKTIDLCAGIGGIRRGFELTGEFENVLSAENDRAAALTYQHLFGEDPTNDIKSEEFKKQVENTEYDILLAGFPCQTFSKVGKKLGFRDTTRGTLFFDIADIILRTKPRAVFLENVENLTFHDNGNTIDTIIRTLEDELKYRVIGVTVNKYGAYEYNKSSFVRNSKYFGVPQNRPRTYIMAFSKERYGDAVKLLNKQLPEKGNKVIYKDVLDILDSEVDDHYYLSEGYLETLKRHKKRQAAKGYGFGYCVVNQTEDEHPVAHTILATGGSGKERNLVYQPKDGVAGKVLKGKKTPINSEYIRVMTPNEWGRLQGIIGYAFVNANGEDQFSFPDGISETQKYKQFGNAVSVPVIETMADFMLECFDILENPELAAIKLMAEKRSYFTKRDVMNELNLNAAQAGKLLRNMVDSKSIVQISRGRSTRYTNDRYREELPPYTQEEKVMELADNLEVITNKDIEKELDIPKNYASILLSELTKKGELVRCSRGRYTRKSNIERQDNDICDCQN